MQLDYEQLIQELDVMQNIPDQLLQPEPKTFRAFSHDEQAIMRLAQKLKIYNQQVFCVLPFDHTMEVAGFGVEINYDHRQGSRPVKMFNSVADMLAATSHDDDQRFSATIGALKLLKQAGESVCFNVTGPVTVAEMLLGFEKLPRLFKDEKQFQAAAQMIETRLFDIVAAVMAAKADIISYGDPTGDISLFGPKYFTQIIGPWHCRILRKMANQMGNQQTLIHLHPALTHSLLQSDLVEIRAIEPVSNNWPGCLVNHHESGQSFVSRIAEHELAHIKIC